MHDFGRRSGARGVPEPAGRKREKRNEMTKRSITWILITLLLVVFAEGCKKKPPAPPPPPPPQPTKAEPPAPPPAPTIVSFSAEPTSINRGQAATLRWQVRDADTVSIEPGIGTVAASGSRQVYPNESTNYTLRASSRGGNRDASARVTVSQPAPPPPRPDPPKTPELTVTELLARDVQDAFFDYDKYDIREDARSVLTRNSDALKSIFAKHTSAVVMVEGHCDERGSAEYNLALGDRRATAAKEFLVQLGVSGDKLRTISYGKERPQCTDANESCWQRNRRAHFAAGQ